MTYEQAMMLGEGFGPAGIKFGYTITLAIWFLPATIISLYFYFAKSLTRIEAKALVMNILFVAVLGFVMEMVCARFFFRFPNKNAVVGIYLQEIPLEELLFYPSGFWFVAVFYVFLSKHWLRRYQKDQASFLDRAKAENIPVFPKPTWRLAVVSVVVIAAQFGIKQVLNPEGSVIPGFMLFMTVTTIIPFFVFLRLTKPYVNTRALMMTELTTFLLSLIWEVTLAIPGGYWQYYEPYMMGVFIEPWGHLAIEAVSVWCFASFVAMTYEFTCVVLLKSGAEQPPEAAAADQAVA